MSCCFWWCASYRSLAKGCGSVAGTTGRVQTQHREGQDCSSPWSCVLIHRWGQMWPLLLSSASLPRGDPWDGPAQTKAWLSRLSLPGNAGLKISSLHNSLNEYDLDTSSQVYYVFDMQTHHQEEKEANNILAATRENAVPYFHRHSDLINMTLESYIRSYWGWNSTLSNSKAVRRHSLKTQTTARKAALTPYTYITIIFSKLVFDVVSILDIVVP